MGRAVPAGSSGRRRAPKEWLTREEREGAKRGPLGRMRMASVTAR